MKRYGNIYPGICDPKNVRQAHKNARKGKMHYHAVRMVDANPDLHLGQIQRTLERQAFRNSKYSMFIKRGRKNRVIHRLPYMPDRIVHHCIVQQLEPIWMRMFIRDTYSTIKGRGIHDGMHRMQKFMADEPGSRYCLKMDVKKFYPSIDHDVLKQILRGHIKCRPTLGLLDEIIDSAPGVPIGNYLSQYFGNLYLNGLDHWIKEAKRVRYYGRYCDDLVLFGSDKSALHELRCEISEYMRNRLRLDLKENWQVFPSRVRGVDFLGYRFWGTRTTVRKNIVKDFRHKIAHIKKHWRHMPAPAVVNSVMSYYGWLAHADARGLWRDSIDDTVRQIMATVCRANRITNPLEGI